MWTCFLFLPSWHPGNDHYIMDSIVFSSKVGLEVNGAANVVKGVHVWFPINQALAFVTSGKHERRNNEQRCFVAWVTSTRFFC